MLSPEQEQDVADWYKEREWLYNFRSEAYKDTGRKNKALRWQGGRAWHHVRRTQNLGEELEGPRIEDPETEDLGQRNQD